MATADVIRVAVAGSTGWTGSAIAEAVQAADDLELVAGISRSGAYPNVAAALDAADADVLVDYTHADAVKANVLAALERGVNVVIGSSGLSAGDFAEIDARARERSVGVIAAGNFSLSAAFVLRFATEAAKHFDRWEVVDYAKDTKPDAPSGTARELAERLGDADWTRVHSVRLPGFVVSTEVIFAIEGERLTLRHDPGTTPAPYVDGTLLAVRSVLGRFGLTRGLDTLL
ncbi:MAG TPA: dihydrodipicolinate reductase C-terminal domain-containing protein [Gaiellaceae bacterium]|nr:dihydrodipicolinate reductase C-terminal domain-containing protein [Gaiellaceae bacterium]